MRNWISPYVLIRIEQVFENFRGYIVGDKKTGLQFKVWSVKGGKPGPIQLLSPGRRTKEEKKKKLAEERKIRNEHIINELKLRKPTPGGKPGK